MQKVRVEIPNRCWLEAEFTLDEFNNIQSVVWHAQGSFDLIEEAQKFFKTIQHKNIEILKVDGTKTSQLLLNQLLKQLNSKGEVVNDVEICQCRKINRSEIVQSILLGAHTPDKVKRWTSASSGCGTCRPDVEKLINEFIPATVNKS